MSDYDLKSSGSACTRCGSQSSGAFGRDGLCVRCAGIRVLQLESGTPWPVDSDPGPRPMDEIGPYEIIEELGHGGMGRVYAARQKTLGRIVALKAIREGMNPEIDLRFLREIQTVAALRHPGIVSVHDSGRASGRVYFSMDYIEGGDLSVKIRTEATPPKEAARLMMLVAEALAYAHGQGILHRDLKPSNILLDGDQPKLADFGLAAQIEAGGDLTALTHVLGTPHYLAPEAMSGGSARQTVASDIYSVGVILFELLTGRTPFAGASAAELPALAGGSDAPPVRLLAPAVPRDLETICLACLEREPSRRYATAAELAADLKRFLSGGSIQARPPSFGYRCWKFAKRHWFGITMLAVFIVLLVGATVISWVMMNRARKAEIVAAKESATSKAVTNFLQNDVIDQANTNSQPNRDITLREVLDNAAARIDGKFNGQPEVEEALRETMVMSYLSLGDYKAAQAQTKKAIELRKLVDTPDGEGLYGDMDELALTEVNLGEREEAKKTIVEAIAGIRARQGGTSKTALHMMVDEIYVFQVSGDVQKGAEIAREAIPLCEKYLGPDAEETLTAQSDLSSMYFWMGDQARAEPLNLKVLDSLTRTKGPESPYVLTSMANLAAVYWAEDKTEKAEEMDLKLVEIRRRVLGPLHPDTLRTLNSLGAAYRENGKLALAEAANRESYEGRLKVLSPNHQDTLLSIANLGWDLMEEGKLDQSDALFAQGVAAAKDKLQPQHFALLFLNSGLSELRRRQGRLAESEDLRAEVYAIRKSQNGAASSLSTLQIGSALAEVQLERGEYAKAEPLLATLVPEWHQLAASPWRTAEAENFWGCALAAQGRTQEGLKRLDDSCVALRALEKDIPPLERRVIAECEARRDAAHAAAAKR